MNYMFYKCPSLTELNLDNFSINNETYITDMFNGCSAELKRKIKTKYKNLKKLKYILM